MATVRVRAEAGIARLMPQGRHEIDVDLDPGDTVARVLEKLGVKPGAVQIVTVNREASGVSRVLADGDQVSLMPMIVGG